MTEEERKKDVRWAMFVGGLKGLYCVIMTAAVVVFVIVLALAGAFAIREILDAVLRFSF